MGYPKARRAARSCARRSRLVSSAGSASRSIRTREVIPTYGSKEAIFSFAQCVVDPARTKDTVVVTGARLPGVRARRARSPARGSSRCRCSRRTASCPTSTRSSDWDRGRALLGQLPEQPDRRDRAARVLRASSPSSPRAHDFLLCSDEAYSELWFDEPPRSALQLDDRANVVVFQTLSKRSSMTGYRSGLRRRAAGGDRPALQTYRPSTGAAPQEFVQRASVVAWDDEEHVERTRDAYRRKREVLLRVLERKGWRVAASEATMYLWVEVPGGETSEACAERLLEHGVVVAPGSYLGAAGEGYVRLALVPTLEECERAAAILRGGAVSDSRRRSPRSTAARSASPSSVGDDWVVNEEAKAAILDYFRLRADGADRARAVRVPRQDPAQARLRRARRARRAAGDRALRLVPLARAS